MRQAIQLFLVVFVLCVAVIGSAFSEVLPKNAVPMTASEVRAFYAGRTGSWGCSYPFCMTYFDPSGRAPGLYGGKLYRAHQDGRGYYERSSWSVTGNRLCLIIRGGYDVDYKVRWSNTSRDCWEWFRVGSGTLTRWVVRYNFTKPGPTDYYKESRLKKGDRVSPVIAKLKSGWMP